jgi:sulfide dehydrogenase cytochrome subunit
MTRRITPLLLLACVLGSALVPDTPARAADAPAPAAKPPQTPPMPPLPMASAAMLAGQCTGCHGDDGASRGPASPSIGGIDKEYFVETMQAFKSGKRHATVMGRIAKGYTDEEIKAMAGHFAAKKWVTHAQPTDAAKVAKGKGLHKKRCEKCHEDNGRASDEGGILAGQWLPYLVFQMEDFTTGKTKMPDKMDKKVQALKPDEIDALLHFYASQK